MWDGTRIAYGAVTQMEISIHPSRVGWDFRPLFVVVDVADFNPPIPCGMGPPAQTYIDDGGTFQSTHPVWDGTVVRPGSEGAGVISIHPSRVGWDG